MLLDSKSQLARLLATENLTIEHRKVQTAYFDTKARKLVIPILQDGLTPSLYDLFVGHEVGHALFTPAEGWHDSIIDLKIPRSIINVVEDARIEKLIKRKYPGLRASFSKAYRELIDRDFFNTKNLNLNNMNLIDRLNMHYKGGASQNIKFDEVELEIIQQMDELESFKDVVDVSYKIMALHTSREEEKKKQKQKQPSQAKEEEESKDEDGEYEEVPSNDVDDAEEKNEEDKKPSDIDDAEEDDFEDEYSDSDFQPEDTKPVSHTDDAFRNREKELLSESSIDYVYGNIPENLNLNSIIVPYKYIINRIKKKSESEYCIEYDFTKFNSFKTKSNKVVSYLVKEFEMRKNAEQMKRATVSKTGELNMSKIHNYQFSEDIFKKMTLMPGGKSHGLVMFLDWSGSMYDHLNSTVKQLLNLVLFCKKVNIPFEVYAFSNQFYGQMEDKNRFETSNHVSYQENDIVMKRFHLLNFMSSKMNAAELSYMANVLLDGSETPQDSYGRRYKGFYDWMQMQYTPLNETIFAAMKIIPKFQKENKLQIVNTVFLTDGEGHQLFSIHNNSEYSYGTGRFHTNAKQIAIMKHKKTNAQIKIVNSSNEAYTSAALSILKSVTGCNVVGFYLLAQREFNNAANRFYHPSQIESIKDEFKKNKNVIAKSAGFDEYYIMKSNVSIDEDDFEVRSNTTRGLVSAFTKYNSGKVMNRIILNKFIGMIS